MTYSVYKHMLQRCLNPKNPKYPRYGGRGVCICAEWLGQDGFENFRRDMGEKPEGLSLDRKENDKGYSKDNCRWVDAVTQSNNTHWNNLVTYQGRTQSLSLWARELNKQRQALFGRLKAGWSVERAFETPCAKFFK